MTQNPASPPLALPPTTVLITGAAGGVGQGIAREFARSGANVVLHYRRSSSEAEQLQEELTQLGAQCLIVGADIRELDQCEHIVKEAVNTFGRLDALVNNAGVQPVEPLDGMTVEQWRAVTDVNLTGTFAMTQAAASAMIADGKGGSITHIASVEASLPAPAHAHYAASKAGVKMHARAAALELGRHGIRVNSVSPGLIDRGDLQQSWPEGHASWLRAVPLQRTGRPEDVGQACVFLASPHAQWISGHDLVVDGGMSAVPAW